MKDKMKNNRIMRGFMLFISICGCFLISWFIHEFIHILQGTTYKICAYLNPMKFEVFSTTGLGYYAEYVTFSIQGIIFLGLSILSLKYEGVIK